MSNPLHRVFSSAAALLVATGLFLALGAGSPAMARTLQVGADKEYKEPSKAAAAARDGDTVIIDPGEYFDCAAWKANKLVIEGAGQKPEDTVITDTTCAGKGLFLTEGQDITIRNLTLTRARVPDGNGAGIRMQANNLTVERVRFVNNQNGILSNNDVSGTLLIRDSAFIANGGCDGSCSHGIYASALDLVRVENSLFAETKRAHHIKSRARRTEVVGTTIQDGPNGTASYLLEIPNGGDVLVRGNTFVKGPRAENRSCAIMIGSEGVTQRTREILIEDNTFHNEGSYDTYFVVNRTATEALLKNNRFTGRIRPLHGDGESR